jgi:hypothetical protein
MVTTWNRAGIIVAAAAALGVAAFIGLAVASRLQTVVESIGQVGR